MNHSPESLRQQRLLLDLPEELRSYGHEVLDPNTSDERLREIREVGSKYHQPEAKPAYEPVWNDYSSEELSSMLENSEVPGKIKDDIAKTVLGNQTLSPEKD